MSRRLGFVGCLVAILLSTGCTTQNTVVLRPATQPVIAAKSLSTAPAISEAAAVQIFQLRGSGAELGEQQGTQLREAIRQLHTAYLKQFIRSDSERFAAMATASIFEAELPAEYREEVHALALATGIDEKQMMLAQCFLDLSHLMACSTVTLPASASPDGVARFGRNLDFPSFNIADKDTVVLVYHPAGRYGFAAVSWPGMIGVLSGMNEHGLCLANMEIKRAPRWPVAMPYTLLYRSVLEQCKSVDEAIELLKKSPRQTANNLMLMDAAGNRAVAEITPEEVHIRQAPPDQALVCTNHKRGDDLDTAGLCWRYDALHDESASAFGSITPAKIEQMLALAAQGDMTMQSMIFEPANGVIYLATGQNAAKRPFQRIELSNFFK